MTAPPFHPNCRTTTVPYFGDDIERELDAATQRMSRNPVTGKSELIKPMSYQQWYEKYVPDETVDTAQKTRYNRHKISGAISGAITDINSDRANQHAELYYEEIRKQKTDVDKIAKNTGYSKEFILEVKDYLFVDEHDLGGRIRRFDPDFAIAQSWQRLTEGNTESHDLTLLMHEKYERLLMSTGMTQDNAHRKASRKYNYHKEAQEYYDSLKKRQKRRGRHNR